MASSLALSVLPAEATPTDVGEDFSTASAWEVAAGSGTLAAESDVSPDGNGALRIQYSLSSNLEVGYSAGAVAASLGKDPLAGIDVDYRGDGTYNTLYLRLRDASGEVFYHRVGTMNSTTWTKARVDLRAPQAASPTGDGVLDYPVTFYRLVVARNGAQPSIGTLAVDRIRGFSNGWTSPSARVPAFDPEEVTDFSFGFSAGGAGDYSLTLTDSTGRDRLLTGTAAAGPVTVGWDGASDDGTPMSGVVSGIFKHDETPDGALELTPVVSGYPNLVSVDSVQTGSVFAEDFATPSDWTVASGSGEISAEADSPDGNGALNVNYSLSSNLEIGYAAGVSPALMGADPLSAVNIDYRGDGTYNTLYLRLQDVTGETFYYRVGNLNSTSWNTARVNLRLPPVSSPSKNGILDAPVTLYRLVVARNGTQPAAGSFALDRVQAVTEGWTKPTASSATFDPSGGEELAFQFLAGTPGDYSLTLSDPAGRSAVLAGAATIAGPVTVTWDGRTSEGEILEGLVSGVFRHDSSADGALDSNPVVSGQQGLVSITGRSDGSEVVEAFESGAAAWVPMVGSVTAEDSTDAVEGERSLRASYDLSRSSTAELGPASTPVEQPIRPYSHLLLDYKGDGSHNTLYVRLRDTAGEDFLYRVGLLDSLAWTTARVDLRNPVATQSGEMDGILTGPVHVFRLMVAQNPGQQSTGQVTLDNLRLVHENWGDLRSESMIDRQSGARADILFTVGSAGDYRLDLRDADGRQRSFTGSSAGGDVALQWDGKSSNGEWLQGTVSAVLRADLVPDGVLAVDALAMGVPYFLALPARPRTVVPPSLVGVNSFMSTANTVAAADDDAELMERAHVSYTREEFNWALMEPRDGYFEWVKTDRAVAVAEGRNVAVIGKLFYTPGWATSAPSGTPQTDARYYPPADMNKFGDYVTAVVDRYKDDVKTWEVWNEPNIQQFWRSGVDPKGYSAMLTMAYQRIKAADPSAQVLVGGLAGFDDAFLKGVVAAGGGNSFDDLAIHTYTNGGPESASLESTLSGARAWIEREKPRAQLWITELGWSTCSCTGAVSETTQADYLSRYYTEMLQYGVKGALWFSLREVGDSQGRDDNYGLVTTAGVLKPGYEALRQAGAAQDSMVYAGSLAPTTGQETLEDPLSSTTGVRLYAATGSSGSLTTSASGANPGGSLQLKYSLAANSGLVELQMSKLIQGNPKALSFWAYGDKSNNAMYLKFKDAKGESFQAKTGNLYKQTWSRQTFYFDGANANYSASGGDGNVDYPITVTSIMIARAPASVGPGTVLIDDLMAHSGDVTRGAMLIGRNFNMQALVAVAQTTFQLPVARNPSYFQNGESYTLLTASTADRATVSLGTRARYVVNTVDATYTASKDVVVLSWQGGSRERLTIQIVDTAGNVVRTLAVNQAFGSGRQTMTWDLRRPDGTRVSAGSYAFKITVQGVDGRSAWVGRSFLVQ